MCLTEGKKKKLTCQRVVEEGFVEKVGFKLYLASTRFYKRGRREHGRRERAWQKGPTQERTKGQNGGNTEDVKRQESAVFGRLAWIWEERGSDSGARLGGSRGQDLFLKLCSLGHQCSIKLEM